MLHYKSAVILSGLRLFCLPMSHKTPNIVKLVINGQDKNLKSSETITQMLQELDIKGSHIAVALNFQVVPRTSYDQTPLNEGDKIEIVHAVGGG